MRPSALLWLAVSGLLDINRRLVRVLRERKGNFDRAFVCRCFCGLQRFSVGADDRFLHSQDDSFQLAFDPVAIPIGSYEDLVDLVQSNSNLKPRLGAYKKHRDHKWEFAEYFTGTVVNAPPDLDAFDSIALSAFVSKNGGTDFFDAYYRQLLPSEFREEVGDLLDKNKFDLDSLGQNRRVLLISIPEWATEFDAHLECITQCRDNILSPPVLYSRVRPHKEFAILKKITDHPINEILSPERPAWGLTRPPIPIPNAADPEKDKEFLQRMQDRWLKLYFLAARFDPIKRSLELNDSIHQQLAAAFGVSNKNTDCNNLLRQYVSLPRIPMSWNELFKKANVARANSDFIIPQNRNLREAMTKAGLLPKTDCLINDSAGLITKSSNARKMKPAVSFLQQHVFVDNTLAPLIADGNIASLMETNANRRRYRTQPPSLSKSLLNPIVNPPKPIADTTTFRETGPDNALIPMVIDETNDEHLNSGILNTIQSHYPVSWPTLQSKPLAANLSKLHRVSEVAHLIDLSVPRHSNHGSQSKATYRTHFHWSRPRG